MKFTNISDIKVSIISIEFCTTHVNGQVPTDKIFRKCPYFYVLYSVVFINFKHSFTDISCLSSIECLYYELCYYPDVFTKFYNV